MGVIKECLALLAVAKGDAKLALAGYAAGAELWRKLPPGARKVGSHHGDAGRTIVHQPCHTAGHEFRLSMDPLSLQEGDGATRIQEVLSPAEETVQKVLELPLALVGKLALWQRGLADLCPQLTGQVPAGRLVLGVSCQEDDGHLRVTGELRQQVAQGATHGAVAHDNHGAKRNTCL